MVQYWPEEGWAVRKVLGVILFLVLVAVLFGATSLVYRLTVGDMGRYATIGVAFASITAASFISTRVFGPRRA